jgi:hypothetical protein
MVCKRARTKFDILNPVQAYDRLKKILKILIKRTEYNMPLINDLSLAIKLVELNNKIHMLILSDHDGIEYNYTFKIFNYPISISTLINCQ